MSYYITSHGEFYMHDASIKPRVDIVKVLVQKGFEKLGVPLFGELSHKYIDEIAEDTTKKIGSGDVVFWQYPVYISDGFYLEQKYLEKLHANGAKVVAILHDVDYLRGWQDTPPEALKLFDGIISTSGALTEAVRSWGVITPIVKMNPFIYRTDVDQPSKYSKKVFYCGRIYKDKAPFLEEADFSLDVYGDVDTSINPSSTVTLHGGIDSDELPIRLTEGFGIIWDGDTNNSKNEQNNLGTYLKYNYPYKLSLYIACNMPIICQKGTNVGDYVENNNIGFTVERLNQVKHRLNQITPDKYAEYEENVTIVRDGVVNGGNIYKACKKILDELSTYIIHPMDIKIDATTDKIAITAK